MVVDERRVDACIVVETVELRVAEEVAVAEVDAVEVASNEVIARVAAAYVLAPHAVCVVAAVVVVASVEAVVLALAGLKVPVETVSVVMVVLPAACEAVENVDTRAAIVASVSVSDALFQRDLLTDDGDASCHNLATLALIGHRIVNRTSGAGAETAPPLLQCSRQSGAASASSEYPPLLGVSCVSAP